MNRYSVRLRLTLWNVMVLGLVLCGFGLALYFSVAAVQARVVDGDLSDRVRGMISGMGDRAFPPPRPGAFPGEGPQPFEGGGPRPGEGPADPEAPGDGPPPQRNPVHKRGANEIGPGYREGLGLAYREYQRPLMFDATGHGVFPHEDDLPWDRRAFETSLFLGQPNYKTLRIDGELLRVYSAPVRRSGAVIGVVQAAQPLGPQQQLLQSVVDTLLILIPIAALLAAAGGLFLTHRAMRPVREVTAAAAELGAKDLSLRLTVRGDDEFAELARTFNGMMARLELTFGEVASGNRALAKAYRRLEEAYNQQRRFTGDASHELRTPLTRIKGSTSLALYGPHDADLYRKALVVADEAADAMSRLVQDLLLLARSDSGQLPIRRSPVDLHEVLREAMKGVGAEPGAAVVIDLPRNLPSIHGDVKHLARLFLNLIHNALRHTPAEGEIRITASATDDFVTVNVADTGEGIPMEHLPHVTERFYRADASRSGGKGGTGLGLAICESIIHAHGGTLFLDSILGKGTTVTVTIPTGPVFEPGSVQPTGIEGIGIPS